MSSLRTNLLIAALLFLLVPPLGCREQTSSLNGPVVRVCLSQNVDHVQLLSAAPVVFKSSGEEGARPLNFPKSVSIPVSLASGGWLVGDKKFAIGELKMHSQNDGALRVNGSAYRGEFRLVPSTNNRFDLINDVPIDAYLKGVLPGELPSGWGIEAYKAQAITARTYALFEKQTRATGRPFDIYSDTRSQVYKGADFETAKSQQAVDETSGIVVAFGPKGEERIFKAYFSSCCGGVGQSVTDAFNEPLIAPLVEQRVGGLCNASPRFSWPTVVLTKAELTRRLRAFGTRRGLPEKDMATVTHIDIANQNQFGRPVRFTVFDARGTQYSLSGEETRWACNADAANGPSPNITLSSSFFKPIADGQGAEGNIKFTDGHGFGHGVGLCQWCAEARAEQGMRHEDIVLLAYPKAVLVRAY